METYLVVPLTLLVIFVLKTIVDFVQASYAVRNVPGFRLAFNIFGFNNVVPRIPGVTFGKDVGAYKHSDFAHFGSDIITIVTALPTVITTYMIADASALKVITGSRAVFPKPQELYTELSFWGENLVVSEGVEWKRHRKVSAPAFTEANNKLVWQETINVMRELFEDVWANEEKIVMDHALSLPFRIALFVIGAAGFGKKMSWKDDNAPPAGHKMNFRDALEYSSSNAVMKALFPNWMLSFTEHGRKVKLAFDEIEKYMFEMVDEGRIARASVQCRHDLFSKLIEASEGDMVGDKRLTDREVISNIFVFLFAGHETTAHTLCFAFALLALYPDEQEHLYQEVLKYLPGDKLPMYEEAHSMPYVTAVLNETLRLFPPVTSVPKRAAEDTTLATTTHAGDSVSVPIVKGDYLVLNFCALHYNPKYWEDPHAFKPSRFLGDWPREAFMPFSGGARSCIGKRFAELESIVVLSMMIKNYKISVKEEPHFAGETFEQTKERIMQIDQGVTQTPKRVPLVFTKRS